MGQTLWRAIFIFGAAVGLAGCGRPLVSHSNVLILAVEGLTPDDIPCSAGSDPQVQSGFDWLCQEGQIYEAVHTDNEYAGPSLASFLFGLSPEKLKLQTNRDFVRADAESFAEQAFERGWSTAFFGSTPLFLRRSGLAQGFEQFNETTLVEAQRWGKGRDQIVQDFLRWRNDIGRSSFYAVLTFSGLNFPWMRATSLSGQERSRTVESQVEGLGESWLALFREMKERKIWDNTWIIVVGLQGRGSGFNRMRVATIVKSPKSIAAEMGDPARSLQLLSKKLHAMIFKTAPVADEAEPLPPPSADRSADAGAFWVHPNGSPLRTQILKKWLARDDGLAPWLQYEFLEQNRSKEFISLASRQGPLDAQAFWERVLSGKKTQILQDSCLRMIDLKIFEGGGSKTCESPTLLALQDWFRQTEAGAEDARVREARTRTLKALHELRSLRRIHMVNWALGNVAPLSHEIGSEILRVEMALRLPDMQTTKTWLDQAEASVIEKTE